jgi:hypothetical protein
MVTHALGRYATLAIFAMEVILSPSHSANIAVYTMELVF